MLISQIKTLHSFPSCMFVHWFANTQIGRFLQCDKTISFGATNDVYKTTITM